jgi:defect-in-organelle-trafficking protein DotC
MKRTPSLLMLLLLVHMASAHADGSTPLTVPPDLNAVLSNSQNAAAESQENNGIPKMRFEILKKAALGYGVQSGLARRSYEISQLLTHNQVMLDSIYNFAALLLDKNVLPPVLSDAENNLNQPDGDTIRIADATYRIEQQARFVTAPPNWRDYLLANFNYTVDQPSDAELPQNDAEKKAWKKLVSDGWDLGVKQANQIFSQSMLRLERDYKGMVLYRRLLAMHMIDRPYVAEADLGVTGNGSAINVNDRILRITSKPQLETNPMEWKPILAPSN